MPTLAISPMEPVKAPDDPRYDLGHRLDDLHDDGREVLNQGGEELDAVRMILSMFPMMASTRLPTICGTAVTTVVMICGRAWIRKPAA